MEQEETIVDIHVANGGAGLGIGTHIGQLIVGAEGFTVVRGSDAAGDIEFLADDVVPDAVDGVDVSRVAGERGNVGHARIHISGANGVTDSLVLINYRLVALRVF